MISKLDIVTKVIEDEFPNTSLIGNEEKVLNYLLKNHRYLFDRHFYLSKRYEGSRQYWQLYVCITGVLNDTYFG